MAHRIETQRGFTLVEAFVVVGVISVLAAVGFQALKGMDERSRYASSTNDVISRLKQARAEAFGQGVPAVFVVRKSTREYWAIADIDGNFDLASFDPATPAPAPDRLLTHRTLPPGIIYGPPDGHGQALPRPYAWVPRSSDCTFCTGAGADYGAVTFHGNGTATLTGANSDGGSFSLMFQGAQGRWAMTYAVIARTGAIQAFERFR
jgi:prepilin-type N-terminal cleavage/methylation domain-containing protein